jgi:hypothetical protein
MDLIIIVLSIFLAVRLAGSGPFKEFLHGAHSFSLLGSFIAGIFFVSIFSVAPAVVVLAEFAQGESVFLIAIFGGLGALLGDWIIFNFVRERLSEDLNFLLKKSRMDRLRSIFRLKLFRHIFIFLGALIVASPLPDEIGLLMMGLSKMKPRSFVPLSLFLNTSGILIITSFAKYL